MKQILICVLLCGLVVQSNSQVKKVESIAITVKDMERSLRFYTEVLNFTKVSETEIKGKEFERLYNLFGMKARVARLQLGEEYVDLVDFLTSGGRSIPEVQKSNDLFFQHIAIVVSDMDLAYQQLRKYNVEHVSTEPQTLPKSIPAAEGIKAFYFHDPDNHNLEIIYFPKGKGQAKWQEGVNQIFLGIDHTAIGISNTQSSHRFYSDLLGIERKGDSWNKGDEQEHLNNVQGASLHITGYRTFDGPGVEFLEYLVPGPGDKYPANTRVDDMWNWQTILVVDNLDRLVTKLKSMHYQQVSDSVLQIQFGTETSKAILVRDPDGHAILLKQPIY
jgi:catechol 2,3-dioxygenase-like lactoylglutathione lyase family enzyme